MIDTFWTTIDTQLNTVRQTRPTTAAQIIDIFANDFHGTLATADAFFAGSGGNTQPYEALLDAGWDVDWIEGDYYWTATHPTTGESITYIEGDIYHGKH